MLPRFTTRIRILLFTCLAIVVIMIFKHSQSHVEISTVNHLDFNRPLIFIGGVPRSGTTLMRALLDVHSQVRCGEETIIIPKLSSLLKYPPKLAKRYEEAKITKHLLNKAIGLAILQLIEGHGSPASILCNKDPFTMKASIELAEIFPNSKFIFMIRDGRAVVHSLISRGITVTSFDLTNYKTCLSRWSVVVEEMSNQCSELGSNRCLPVYFEQLVLHPQEQLGRILKFIGIDWEDSLLNHHNAVGGEISISKLEWSNDQIAKPINIEPLTKWAETFPEDLKSDVHEIAPSLELFGYNPHEFPPYYGKPDDLVLNNTASIHNNEMYWKEKTLKLKHK